VTRLLRGHVVYIMKVIGVLVVMETMLLLLLSRVDTELVAKRKGGYVDIINTPLLKVRHCYNGTRVRST